MKTYFLTLLLYGFCLNSWNLAKFDCPSCTESQSNITVPEYVIGDWKENFGPTDGRFYECNVEFIDNFKGRVFKGGTSGRYFIEDSTGKNYYFRNEISAINALYIYKKNRCITSKNRT